MKKLLIMASALALTLASCGNKQANTSANADSALENVEAATNETTTLSEESKTTVEQLTATLQKAISAGDAQSTISTLANLQTIYKNLVEQGKLEEAKAYGTAIKQFMTDNKESLQTLVDGNSTVSSLVSGIANLPTSAETTAEQAKAAITNDVVNLASPAIAKGETAVATAKAAAEMVKNAPAAVKSAAENAAKSAVSNAVSSAEQQATATAAKTAVKAVSAANEAKAKTEAAVEAEKQKTRDKVNEGKQKANDAVNKAADKALKKLGL